MGNFSIVCGNYMQSPLNVWEYGGGQWVLHIVSSSGSVIHAELA